MGFIMVYKQAYNLGPTLKGVIDFQIQEQLQTYRIYSFGFLRNASTTGSKPQDTFFLALSGNFAPVAALKF